MKAEGVKVGWIRGSRHRRLRATGLGGLLALSALVASTTAGAQAPPQKPPPPPPAITGKWVLTLEMQVGTATPTLELVQEGEKLKGSYAGRYGKFPLMGVVKARTVQFTVQINADGQETEMNFAGEIAADGASMKGDADLGGMGEATWHAKRAPAGLRQQAPR